MRRRAASSAEASDGACACLDRLLVVGAEHAVDREQRVARRQAGSGRTAVGDDGLDPHAAAVRCNTLARRH